MGKVCNGPGLPSYRSCPAGGATRPWSRAGDGLDRPRGRAEGVRGEIMSRPFTITFRAPLPPPVCRHPRRRARGRRRAAPVAPSVAVMASTGPFHNVVDYGASGDGRTDDTAAVLSAIAAAAPPSAPTGNTVVFPAGTYRITAGLSVPPGVRLQGVGWNTPAPKRTCSPVAGSWWRRSRVQPGHGCGERRRREQSRLQRL